MYLPRFFKQVLSKICGQRGPQALDSCWTYVCYTSNPFVQIFYLCVVIGGYGTFAAYGYPSIPSRLLSWVHKYIGFIIFAVCLAVWWKASTVNPGKITKENVKELCSIYEYDDVIFQKGNCKTCGFAKPARSKHCSLCNACVARFDHHCIWINNCVGVGNHRLFLMFLFMHLVICLYGFGLGGVLIYEEIVDKDLMKATFIDPVSQQRYPADWKIIAQYLMATQGMVIFVMILGGVMGFVLLGFFFWHLNLVRTGTTTNELSKWSHVKWILKQDNHADQIKHLVNIYNQGCFANFWEVLFPINVATLGSKPQIRAEKDKKSNQKAKKN